MELESRVSIVDDSDSRQTPLTSLFRLKRVAVVVLLPLAGFFCHLDAETAPRDRKPFEEVKGKAESGDADSEYQLSRRSLPRALSRRAVRGGLIRLRRQRNGSIRQVRVTIQSEPRAFGLNA